MKKITSSLIASLFAVATTVAVAQSAAPNDTQIAGIVVTANTIDIGAGKLAQK